MSAKYYTQFLLADTAGRCRVREYSGVVEVTQPVTPAIDPRDIEHLLARNLACEARQVKLIDWSRLH